MRPGPGGGAGPPPGRPVRPVRAAAGSRGAGRRRAPRRDRGDRAPGEVRVGEQAGRPARHDLVHPGAPGVAEPFRLVGGFHDLQAGEPVEPAGAAGAGHHGELGVDRGRVAQPGGDGHRLPCLDLGEGGVQRGAGRREGEHQPLRGGGDERGESCGHAGAVPIAGAVGGHREDIPALPSRDMAQTTRRTWPRPRPGRRVRPQRAPEACSTWYRSFDVLISSLRSCVEPTIGWDPCSGTCALSGRNLTVTSPMTPARIR